MIAYIRGILSDVSEEGIVVEANGVGYQILVPSTTLQELPETGREVKILTHFSVTEDAMRLYGFWNREELELFRMMIKVSGIGPKGAISILSVLSADDLRFAVLAEDDKAICRAPGIGKKTAQKLILELKDKMDLQDAFESKSAHTAKAQAAAAAGGAKEEAVLALTALGYSGTEALKAVKACDLPEDASSEDWIREALKHMM